MLAPGALVGSYRITGTLGAGGMGVVYVAEHVVLGSRAAIKVLLPEAAAIAEIVHRFINEARASAALKHRNIVQVYDCGQLPDGQWFIALEFLEGSPLAKFIASHGGPIALPIIVQILGQAAHGLHVAHENGFVHRDVKPDNLFLTQTTSNDHHVTILDFGIAKLGEARAGLETKTNVAMGTPAYMAPEQLRDAKTVDRRSDVYALGVIAYEMATGRRPWGDVTAPGAVMELQVTALRPPNPCDVRTDIAAPFGAVIAKALAVRPEDRYATAQEFVLALAHATPGNDWSESGIEILRRYANELTLVDAESETVGRKVPSAVSHAGMPTVRAVGSQSGAPAPVGRASDVRTVPLGPVAVPVSQPTTLGSSAAQSVAPIAAATPTKGAPNRKFLAGGAVAVVVGVATIVGLVVANQDDRPAATERRAAPAPLPPASAPSPTMSALAVFTEPAGARVYVDGAERGLSPLNVPLAVGAEVRVRVELPGFEPAEQTTRVTDALGTMRLTLAPVPAIDEGAPAAKADLEPPVAPAAERKRKSRGKAKPTGSEPGFDPDGVVGE